MAASSLAAHVGVAPACRALGVSRATWYRRRRPAPGRQQPRPTPARALNDTERERVLEQQIEADLLYAIGDVLPRSVRENLQRIAASVDATVAALIFLFEARRVGTMTLPEIIEFVSSQTVQQGTSAGRRGGIGAREPAV